MLLVTEPVEADDQYCLRTCLLEAIGSSAACNRPGHRWRQPEMSGEEQRWDAACTVRICMRQKEAERAAADPDTFRKDNIPALWVVPAYGERSSGDCLR